MVCVFGEGLCERWTVEANLMENIWEQLAVPTVNNLTTSVRGKYLRHEVMAKANDSQLWALQRLDFQHLSRVEFNSKAFWDVLLFHLYLSYCIYVLLNVFILIVYFKPVGLLQKAGNLDIFIHIVVVMLTWPPDGNVM